MIKQLFSLVCVCSLLVASGCSMSKEKLEQAVTTQADDGSTTEPSTEGTSEEMGSSSGDMSDMSSESSDDK